MKNISERLKPGGLFIGTTVNDMELIARARQAAKVDEKKAASPKPPKQENLYSKILWCQKNGLNFY